MAVVQTVINSNSPHKYRQNLMKFHPYNLRIGNVAYRLCDRQGHENKEMLYTTDVLSDDRGACN
jgi:hypothetical protein